MYEDSRAAHKPEAQSRKQRQYCSTRYVRKRIGGLLSNSMEYSHKLSTPDMPQIQISKYDYLPGATPVRSGGEMKGGVGWG